MARSKTTLVKNKQSIIKNYLTVEYVKSLIWDPRQTSIVCYALLILEIFLNVFVIENVKYTDIDWSTYMQTVGGFLNGTLDYKQLGGDTGSIQYPAGYVYVYSLFYYLTNAGTNIRLAQYVFLLLYILLLALVFRIYVLTTKVPPCAILISVLTSYRIHSIFVLRLFNDPIAVLLFYAALNLFISNRWYLGSVFFSLAVSIKMNILLYAPSLLIAYVTNLAWTDVVVNLFICGIVQVILGAPFLLSNPWSYLELSFNMGRIFEHKWTVNYRFLDIATFENRLFHVALLVVHISLLALFLQPCIRYFSSYAKLNKVAADLRRNMKSARADQKGNNKKVVQEASRVRFDTNAQLFVLPFFVANVIGIACARSLHYQFYCWYFHSLPYLVYCTGFSTVIKFLILAVIELCWNIYPSTSVSSVTLHVTNAVLLVGIYRYMKN